MTHKNGTKGSKQHDRYLVTRRVDIRKSNPGLYRAIMIAAFACVAEGFNFLFSTPTFKPYDLSNDLIALIFLALGLGMIIFLNLYHLSLHRLNNNLLLVRITASLASGFLLFWGVTNTQQVFLNKASFQLPVVYIGLALMLLQRVWEPSVNPITMKKDFE